jgi:hypothetical protein
MQVDLHGTQWALANMPTLVHAMGDPCKRPLTAMGATNLLACELRLETSAERVVCTAG